MPRWPFRWRRADVPTDAETAAFMRRLAEMFVAGIAEDGWIFTWNEAEVSRLDDLCAEFLRSDPPAAVRHSMTMTIGAYLGELLVRLLDAGFSFRYPLRADAARALVPRRRGAAAR